MSEYAVGGPILSDAPLPQIDNSYVMSASQLRQLGPDYDPNGLKRFNDTFPDSYTTPTQPQVVPDADWFIGGHRYRVVSRTETESGYTLSLERADIAPLYTIEEP